MRRTRLRDPAMDDDLSVIVIPQRGARTILGLVYTDQEVYRKLVLGHPLVEEYAYWNNSDEPDHVTARAWKERGKRWDAAVGAAGVPGIVGLSRDYHEAYALVEYPNRATLTKLLPTVSQRATALFDPRHEPAAHTDFIKRAKRASFAMIHDTNGTSTLKAKP